jgi:hypothetical protein
MRQAGTSLSRRTRKPDSIEQCKWGAKRLDTYSPLAPFNGEMAERFNALVCKTSGRDEARHRRSDPRVRIPLSPPYTVKLFERSGPRFEPVFSRLIPIRRFARRANPRFADCAFARHPLVGAPITFIPFLLERNHAHTRNNILVSNIFSRKFFLFPLTNIYLTSNIFLR